MEISETRFDELCRASQRLETMEDYIIESASRGYEYITTEMAACLLDMTKTYHQAVEQAKEAAHGTDSK